MNTIAKIFLAAVVVCFVLASCTSINTCRINSHKGYNKTIMKSNDPIWAN